MLVRLAVLLAAALPRPLTQRLVDQVWAEGTDPTGAGPIHGNHRGVLLVEFLDVPWG
jgi:hypothetical protein